jgi:glutaredoxin
MKIEIYGREGCPFCDKAKGACASANLPFTYYTVGSEVTKEDIQKRVDALGLHVTIATVPQIFVDDAYVGGYTELLRVYPWARAYNSSQLRK